MMGIHDKSMCELRRTYSRSVEDFANSSLRSLDSPAKVQINKSIKGLFASFGLTPPPSICRSGSRDALWFSTKFEKKMAALEDETPASPLTRFQRAVPLRQSKLNSGPFRATQIWNEVIDHLKEKVELKKRRYKLRNYEDCFTGTDAVDVVLHYLLSDQDTFCNLSREKAVKLCQTLMDKKVFSPVGSKSTENNKHTFEDSSGKIYHFRGVHGNKENATPGTDVSDSEEEMEGRDEACETIMEEGESMTTPPEKMRLSGDADTSLLGSNVIYNPMVSDVTDDEGESGLLGSRKRKNLDSSQRIHKRAKLSSTPATSSTESLNEDTLTYEQIQEIGREVALCQLLTIVDLSFLDGVLSEEKDKDKPSRKIVRPHHHSGVVSNIVAKHWSMRCTARSASHTDPFMKSALECIAHIPRGISKFDTDFSKSSDPVTKLQAYNMICEHYSMRPDGIFPERFLDLNLAIMKLILSERNGSALHAMQLNMILLPNRQKEELKRLLKFMSVAATDNDVKLDQQMDNEQAVLNHLSECVLKHKGLPWDLSSIVVRFLVHNAGQVFTTPRGFKERVDTRIAERKEGIIPVVEETVFCSQVSESEYKKQTEECTNNSLVLMMNTIIDNPKMALKEKKQRLQKFRKYHPNIYAKHFSGMV